MRGEEGEDVWLGECPGVRGEPARLCGGAVVERGERLGDDTTVGIEGVAGMVGSSNSGGGRGEGGGDVRRLDI